jgi:phage gp37-like protein
MSRLGDLENAIVSRLAAATISGSPVFATVRGVSGGYRPVLRDAIRRERMPAAFVAFTDEPTAPEILIERLGAHFTVLVAAQMLRAESNPRLGDATALGAFTLMDKVRTQLDGYMPSTDIQLQSLAEKFVDADERVAIYELTYRAWPVAFTALTFGGESIAGDDSRMRIEIGSVIAAGVEEEGPRGRPIVWRGQIRAEDHEALNGIEEEIESAILARQSADVVDDGVRSFSDCLLAQYLRIGPRYVDPIDGAIFQRAELLFMQQFEA